MNQKSIQVLDCTLRDGGYINGWNFGETGIHTVLNALDKSKVEIIEVGFLSNRIEKNNDLSKFRTIQDMSIKVDISNESNMKVCMINFGEYDFNDLPHAEEVKIKGIRVAFHKKDMDEAMIFSSKLIDKGYLVFIQPMVAANYNDEEYVKLIQLANKIKPYAFYIVDSFGEMDQEAVEKYFHLVESNLFDDIYVGFHSHNNLQLSYSNAQYLINLNKNRNLIIDSSIHGMGRGAGNLNTELFMEYLNKRFSGKYLIDPLLTAIDFVIKPIYSEKPWGYSLPHYLSAINNCHPNYATYLDDLSTLTVTDINNILKILDQDMKNNFDEQYIKSLYNKYQMEVKSSRDDINVLSKYVSQKDILLIAPGKSIIYESAKITEFIKSNEVVVFGVNFQPEDFNVDFLFYSNKRRYQQSNFIAPTRTICTSNIVDNKTEHFIVNYQALTTNVEAVEDNSGLMILKLLQKLNVKKVFLAGFDGYSLSKTTKDSFASTELSTAQTKSRLDRINLGMNYMLNKISHDIDIEFITQPVNLKIYNEDYYE
jgi:4-hydroxy 2-oxovalerate aldolase